MGARLVAVAGGEGLIFRVAMRTSPETLPSGVPGATALPGVQPRPREGEVVARARDALARGPLAPVDLLERVLSMRGTPPPIAERLAESLLRDHPSFRRGEDGRWREGVEGPVVVTDPPRLQELRYAVVDVETTGGGSRSHDRVTEIAVVPLEGGAVGEAWSSLVNPGRAIPAQVTRLTGISDAMVRGAPVFPEVVPQVVGALQGRVFVAHHAAFDWGFVNSELLRAEDRVLVGDRLCTVRLARVLLPGLRRRSLDALGAYFGVTITGRHRALGDALATAEILGRLLEIAEEQGHHTWPQLSARLDRRTSRARRPRSAFPRPVDCEPAA